MDRCHFSHLGTRGHRASDPAAYRRRTLTLPSSGLWCGTPRSVHLSSLFLLTCHRCSHGPFWPLLTFASPSSLRHRLLEALDHLPTLLLHPSSPSHSPDSRLLVLDLLHLPHPSRHLRIGLPLCRLLRLWDLIIISGPIWFFLDFRQMGTG